MDNNPIKRALKYRGRDIKWLASKLNKDYTSLCKRIKEQTFSVKEINEITSILNLKARVILLDENSDLV